MRWNGLILLLIKFPGSLSLFIVFSLQLSVNKCYFKNCSWMASNLGPLVSEKIATTSALQVFGSFSGFN